MNKTMRSWLILFFSLVPIISFAKSANANTVQICNYSTSNEVAVAYSRYLDGDWWVEGWRRIEQGNCSDIYHEGSSFYYYANAVGAADDSEWSGEVRHCVLSRKFKLIDNRSSCDRGRWEYFIEKTGLGEFRRIRLID